jgi:hypothetical protein
MINLRLGGSRSIDRSIQVEKSLGKTSALLIIRSSPPPNKYNSLSNMSRQVSEWFHPALERVVLCKSSDIDQQNMIEFVQDLYQRTLHQALCCWQRT